MIDFMFSLLVLIDYKAGIWIRQIHLKICQYVYVYLIPKFYPPKRCYFSKLTFKNLVHYQVDSG